VQELLNAVTLGSVYLLFALGMSLTWGTIDILNFSHGAIFMFASFSAYLMLEHSALSLGLLILLGMIAGAALSFLVQFVVFEPILRRSKDKGSAEIQVLIGGIGTGMILLAIAQHKTRSNPFGLNGSSTESTTWHWGGAHITDVAVLTIVVAISLWLVVGWWLRRSRQGLALRAIGVDADVAALMGIDRRGLAMVTMAISGALAGLAGILFTFLQVAITPESGDTLLLKAFACIVLGGVGSMAGVAFGAFLLAGAETVLLTRTDGSWVDAISFGLIVLVLLIRPSGMFGRAEVRRT